MGNSSPNRARTASPQQGTRLVKARDQWRGFPDADRRSRGGGCFPPARNQSTSRSFSLLDRDRRPSFIHWPPHGAGSKKGTTRNGLRTAVKQASSHRLALRHFGCVHHVRIEDKIPNRHERGAPSDRRPASRQKTPRLYCNAAVSVRLVVPRLSAVFAPKTQLGFPSRKVGVDENIRLRREKTRTAANDQDKTL